HAGDGARVGSAGELGRDGPGELGGGLAVLRLPAPLREETQQPGEEWDRLTGLLQPRDAPPLEPARQANDSPDHRDDQDEADEGDEGGLPPVEGLPPVDEVADKRALQMGHEPGALGLAREVENEELPEEA